MIIGNKLDQEKFDAFDADTIVCQHTINEIFSIVVMDFLLKNPLVQKKMGKNGKKYLLKNYNLDKIVEKYLLFWRALIANTSNTSYN